MKIFIAGGTGFVGGHVVRALLERGHQLTLLVHRRGRKQAGVEQVEGDITSPESFAGAVAGCDALINLVGIIREFPGRGISFERLHVQATANMVAAAVDAGVPRYLQMSALGTRPEAVSQYHRTKFLAEETVRASGLAWTIFRPSLIYGPQDAFVNMLADQLRLSPVFPVIGNGRYRLQPIHADDVARCFALALEMPETVGGCYELCGSDRLTFVELLDAVAAAMGRKAPLKPLMPLPLIRPLVRLLQRLPGFPITLDQLQMLLEESICDGGWREQFGVPPRDFRRSIGEYLRG